MEFEIVKKERLFEEFFKVDKVRVRHDNFRNGERSLVRRYHLSRPDAVAVVLENISKGTIVLVEQFRYATIQKYSKNGWILEIIAGLKDVSGESEEACAIRETLEETGYRVSQLEFITTYYASVGISDEKVTLFYGQVTDEDKVAAGGGLEHENEDLAVREIPFQELMDKVKNGTIVDSKTIIGLQWLSLKKLNSLPLNNV